MPAGITVPAKIAAGATAEQEESLRYLTDGTTELFALISFNMTQIYRLRVISSSSAHRKKNKSSWL